MLAAVTAVALERMKEPTKAHESMAKARAAPSDATVIREGDKCRADGHRSQRSGHGHGR